MRLAELRTQAERLGVSSEGKKDVIERRIALHHIGPNPSKAMALMLELGKVMKPYRWDALKEHEKEMLIHDEDGWVMERKINGCRMVVIVINGIPYFFSSHTHRHTYIPIQYYNLGGEWSHFSGCIVDCEVEWYIENNRQNVNATSGELTKCRENKEHISGWGSHFRFTVFDLLYTPHKGFGAMLDPFKHRRMELCNLQPTQYDGMHITIPKHYIISEGIFSWLLDCGEEGVIYKNLNSSYLNNGKRDKNAWIKRKRTATYDAFITGYSLHDWTTLKEGTLATLELSIWKGAYEMENLHTLCNVGSLTDKQVALLSCSEPEREDYLDPSWYNKVVEVEGQNLNENWKLIHPRIVRFRTDKNKGECVYKESLLEERVVT